MKFALFLVLALSAVAFAGPAFNKNNQIQQDAYNKQQQYMTTTTTGGAFSQADEAKSPAVQTLKQWCFASQMSQQELTASFKKLVSAIKSNPTDQVTEAAVMGERICQGQLVAKSQQTGETVSQGQADAKAHELIKDVYMDAMISCKSHQCTQQLLKTIQSQKVDSIRASYYMTRIAVTDKQEIKDEQEIKQLAEAFLEQHAQQHKSEAVERQQLFATTALIGKWISSKPSQGERQQMQQVAEKVAQQIVQRYIKSVSQQEVEQYKQIDAEQQQQQQPQQTQQQQEQLIKKIAKRGAALKALANIPGHVLKSCPEVEECLVQLAQEKRELSTVRQSAIECLEQNDQQVEALKELTFAEEEPIEVRVAAYRALMTSMFAIDGEQQQQQQQTKTKEQKQKIAEEIVEEIVKHCEQKQQQDEQFVLYAVSHLDNVRTSQQSEVQAIKETLQQNKQHYMQIQLLAKKLKAQLADVRRASRNYKLEQEFSQLDSGLVLEGDIIYESQQNKQHKMEILPKLIRVNASMPVMGETVNVIEITLRQDNMDQELLAALKMVQNTKFNQQTVTKVVDQFKQSAERQQYAQKKQTGADKQAQADLTIKVDGCTVVYLCLDDFKGPAEQHRRQTRSIYSSSVLDEILEHLKRQPVSFNRGFNFNIQERIAKVLDIDANILAGLRFESHAKGVSAGDFEIVAQVEPRLAVEAITGPAKVSSKKLLQRFSTKSACGLRLRFKEQELVDVELELPMNTMELFTFETQLVEKRASAGKHADQDYESYSYLPESIYGQEDIYASYPIYSSPEFLARTQKHLSKRSIVPAFVAGKEANKSTFAKVAKKLAQLGAGNKGGFSHSFESSARVTRATGLKGKLRVVASPKELSCLVSAVIEKQEPQMRGLRVKLEQQGGRSQADLKSYTLTLMTPGSSVDRTMQVRVTQQQSAARTLVKAEIVSPHMQAGFTGELVHEQGRQYSAKAELVSRARQQWRHALEIGLVQGPSASSSGRLAHFNYKPFLQLDSSALARPVAMQGQIAYVQSPKSVISYELKCATTGDFVQGKLIFDARDNKMSQSLRKRTAGPFRRSMQSPIELVASKDLTLTSEFIGQVQQHAVKAHQMLDWDCTKYSVQANAQITHKNLRKSQTAEGQLLASMKLDAEQQVFAVERKCAQDARKNWTARVLSQVRAQGHQMEAECRYAGARRQQPAIVAYKHKIEAQKVGANKYECGLEVELVDSERAVNEKAAGRVRVANERKQKQCSIELASVQSRKPKSCKLAVDFESLAKHQVQFALSTERVAHKSEMRNNERAFSLQSRTEKPGTQEQLVKLLVEVAKEATAPAAKVVIEVPVKRASLAADLKLGSGQRSSIAVQSGRFASQAEFSFDLKDVSRASRFYPFQRAASLRFRSSLKDLEQEQAYWMESQVNAGDADAPSFLRLESPYYRSELEFAPRAQEAKLAAYGRVSRAQNQMEQIYKRAQEQGKGSLFESIGALAQEKLSLGPSKMWMVRSIVSSPFARDQLKQQARRALFEYADRRQQHKHSLNWSPEEERISMELSREPNAEFGAAKSADFEPLRLKAELSTEFSRPSNMQLESSWMDAELEAKPFGHRADEREDSYAKLAALSRHPRSTFAKHETEIRYNKNKGYKAHMKHQDKDQQRGDKHELRAESDVAPHRHAKLAYESDKHGKTQWEHKWRQAQQKRAADQEDVFASQMHLKREGPQGNRWMHETKFDWEEPARVVAGERRQRRSIFEAKKGPFGVSPIEYLKSSKGRLVSTYTEDAEQQQTADQYKMELDYQPMSTRVAAMNFDMPREMAHQSSLEINPTERLYKLQSKLYNRRTNEPSYELLAATKPLIGGLADATVDKLATAEQEPVFVHSSHPMLERPISEESLVYQLFKQPMKLDYSDKYGRVATFDYDQLVDAAVQQQKLGGLRQKRAALFYKDPMAEIEHQSSYDFYPEQLLGQIKPSYYQQQQQQQQQQIQRNQRNQFNMTPVAMKTHTKYGPVVVRAESTEAATILELESPILGAKLVGETGANLRALYKIQLDNKSQRVQLAKLLRECPQAVRQSKLVQKLARKFDSNKFEQQAEILVSIVDQIFKIKSQTKLNERPVVTIEGEWNEQTDKAYAKINGQRVQGQCIVDLVRKSADLSLELDDKRTLHHVTRLVKTSDKFYSLESMTSHKSRPLFKLAGKVAAKAFDLEHLLSENNYERRQAGAYEPSEHLSTFEAVVYEPKELHISGQFDCDKKEARIVAKNPAEQRVQETQMSFDQDTQTISMVSQLSSKHEGQVYLTKAKISLPGLYQSDKCGMRADKFINTNKYISRKYNASMEKETSCKSEMIYSDKSGVWGAQYYPGEFASVQTPRGKSTINLAY